MSSPGDRSGSVAPGPGYEALTSGVALWVDPDRVLLRVEGTRAAAVLNGLLSADVIALEPGDSTVSFVLTSRGRPVAVPVVVRAHDSILLDVTRAALQGLFDGQGRGILLRPGLDGDHVHAIGHMGWDTVTGGLGMNIGFGFGDGAKG